MPQDTLLNEERKDEVSFDEKIPIWVKKLKSALRSKTSDIETHI
jgi:hypothetical protein